MKLQRGRHQSTLLVFPQHTHHQLIHPSLFLPQHNKLSTQEKQKEKLFLPPDPHGISPPSAFNSGQRTRDGDAQDLWDFLRGLPRGGGGLLRASQLDRLHHVLPALLRR